MADVIRRVDVTLEIRFRSSFRVAIVAARLPYGVAVSLSNSPLDEAAGERFDCFFQLLLVVVRNFAILTDGVQ